MKAAHKNTAIIAASVLSLLIVFLAINYFIWQNNYRGRFYPGERIGNISLSGQTREEANKAMAERLQAINQAGLSFEYNQQSKKLDLDVISFDSDLVRPTLSFDSEALLATIFKADDRNSFIDYLLSLFTSQTRKTYTPSYSLDEEAIRSFLGDNFKDLNIEPMNAYFSLADNNQKIEITANQERPGKGIDYDKVFSDVRNSLANLEPPVITIRTVSLYPEIKRADLIDLEDEAQKIISHGELTISFNESDNSSSTIKYWKIRPNRLATWISLTKTLDSAAVSLDQEKIKAYITAEIAPDVNKEAILPRFEVKNGKVSSWQTGENGREIDLEASAQAITRNLLSGQTETGLIIKEVAEQNIKADNNLQIKELLGTGYSKFAGSPTNRRKNIKTGADALHGILIKPNEEFSLIKTLGAIDASTGYLPELVIKGNKTVPEFGGGLCQIGTTVFRAALSSGLPITMRQNHSYRVSYYEPAGMDATIYDPKPDLRFVNDTGNYILIQARIVKDDLYFDFWGTKDGRVATTTYPTIYNIVKPAPTKLVETTTLKPGEKKCTESSHNGADAFFDYKVIYPEGSTTTPIQERRFSSHYVPWQAVCLIGIAASSTPAVASSTPVTGSSTPAVSSSSAAVSN
ncbi:MAG: VanW family protein [Patescibacteria group bacterium]|jgi:vancomycin resistance protein YoaR